MARVTVEDCLEKVDNRFELVRLASKRARQLALTAVEPLVPLENDKPTVLALREIAEGLVDKESIENAAKPAVGNVLAEEAVVVEPQPSMDEVNETTETPMEAVAETVADVPDEAALIEAALAAAVQESSVVVETDTPVSEVGSEGASEAELIEAALAAAVREAAGEDAQEPSTDDQAASSTDSGTEQE